jgi:predicted lipid-binding transport protein (Tim44 family)
MTLQDWGAGGFGAVIGWYLYFINRYRKADVQIGDLTTVIGAIGGGAVTALFSPSGQLFAAYGLGLAVGFFAYFIVLVFLVGHSKSFTSDWFLDGRRPDPPQGWGYSPDAQQTVRPLDAQAAKAPPAAATQNFYISPVPGGGQFVAPAQAAPRQSG